MPYFRFSRVERVIARWTIEAESLADAMDKWEEQATQGITLEGEEVTEVYEENWADADGNDLTADADAISELQEESTL
jgi:hypothetical protein